MLLVESSEGSVASATFEYDQHALILEFQLKFFVDLIAVMREGLMDLVVSVDIVVLDKNLDGFFEIILSVQHAEVGDVFGV